MKFFLSTKILWRAVAKQCENFIPGFGRPGSSELVTKKCCLLEDQLVRKTFCRRHVPIIVEYWVRPWFFLSCSVEHDIPSAS